MARRAATREPTELRRDARENRARVLAIAKEAFATEGLALPIDDIAKRAGLGIGTLYRHFPTKQHLIAAIVEDRFIALADEAAALAAGPRPEDTFFVFLERLAAELANKRDLGDALAGFDLYAKTADIRERLRGSFAKLLRRAHDAGAVRPELEVEDVTALVSAVLPVGGRSPGSAPRIMAVVRDGLRPPRATPKPRRAARRP
ncbi:MAG: helix-turn-helix domain-containing protein [Polyangiales bacterium]